VTRSSFTRKSRRARNKRRKPTAAERKLLPASIESVETVDLSDPNLDPFHRDNFIKAIRLEAARLDALIELYYRHRGECNIPDCDCGGELAEQAEKLCSHLFFIKHAFGQIIIDDHPSLARFVKECGEEDHAYEHLTRDKSLPS
jgi:hypothetical protein